MARIKRAERDEAPDWIDAEVITPMEDEQARRICVMDFLRWALPARTMAKRLRWRFDEIVE